MLRQCIVDPLRFTHKWSEHECAALPHASSFAGQCEYVNNKCVRGFCRLRSFSRLSSSLLSLSVCRSWSVAILLLPSHNRPSFLPALPARDTSDYRVGQRIHARAYASGCVRALCTHTGSGSHGGAFPPSPLFHPDYLSTCTRYCDYASLTCADDSCHARQHPLVSLSNLNIFLITLEEESATDRRSYLHVKSPFALLLSVSFYSLFQCTFFHFRFIARFRRLLVIPLSGISRCRRREFRKH